jgi:hypothetical protein
MVDPRDGGGCEIANFVLIFPRYPIRLETLLNAGNLLSYVDVHIAKMGGSSFFYELWWIYVGGGCKTGGAH